MTPKEYLSRIQQNRDRIRKLEEMIKELHIESAGTGIDYSRDKVQTSPVNALELKAWRMLERREAIQHRIMDLQAEITQIQDEILEIDEAVYRELLWLRYSNGVDRFDDVAVIMGYTYDWIKHLHGNALEAFRRRFPEHFEKHDT